MFFSLIISTEDNKNVNNNIAKERYDMNCFSIAKKEIEICTVKIIVMIIGTKYSPFRFICMIATVF